MIKEILKSLMLEVDYDIWVYVQVGKRSMQVKTILKAKEDFLKVILSNDCECIVNTKSIDYFTVEVCEGDYSNDFLFNNTLEQLEELYSEFHRPL